MDVGADLKDSQPLAYSLGFLRPLVFAFLRLPCAGLPLASSDSPSWRLLYLSACQTSDDCCAWYRPRETRTISPRFRNPEKQGF
jgi:hypothetical protein